MYLAHELQRFKATLLNMQNTAYVTQYCKKNIVPKQK